MTRASESPGARRSGKRAGGRTAPLAAAFTLLEVMAAVAVLGLVYVVIARVAVESLGLEGDAQRRLRASLVADRVVAEIEEAARLGGMPQLGRTELEDGPFRLLLEVTPMDPASLGLAGVLAEGPQGVLAGDRRGAQPPPALFAPAERGLPPILLQAHLRVSWLEGFLEQEVTRTTFFFDPHAAAAELQGLAPPPEEGG